MRRLRIGMAQVNATVGDFDGNLARILRAMNEARSLGVDLLTFPELVICGYPPEDLLLKPQFIEKNLEYLDKVIKASMGLTAIVGFVDDGEDPYNAAAIIHGGKLAGVYHKVNLPNYGVYDENRYFQPGTECPVWVVAGVGIGVNICEDIWTEAGPATTQAYGGAEVIVNISGSPYHYGKWEARQRMLATRAADDVAIVVYNNLVGGQDELVFDGNSMVFDEEGTLLARGKQFSEDLVVVDLDIESVHRARLQNTRWRKQQVITQGKGQQPARIDVSGAPLPGHKPTLPQRVFRAPEPPGEVYDALVMGSRDYIKKNGFKGVVIGLSGGIDSSLVAAIAVDALGAANVTGVVMSSIYSSAGSIVDAEKLAANLGIKLLNIPIKGPFDAYREALAEVFAGTKKGVAEENIQARIRGNILMALSNRFGWLVLTTGNKSEFATGYTTLYGDMAGGFAVIKDVYKTMAYRLAGYRNRLAGSDLIPESVMQKVPSAELRPGQKDSDNLPPYDLLDPILKAYVEEDKSVEQIIALGYDKAVVKKVARLVDGSEYKRRQAPPGVKITPKAFGRDRRLPITNRFQS